ncbi:iron complex transport system ATP-binding protein [Marinilabilia salmonicolor]|jgi:iron complex transport system ATP-binding protein|uniref:ABC transporter ATP-binding protein n=1 Tax=Marinilabilia salmonicolor TaxID=989 RepID=UPI000D054C79|nr:ABC transporter ATP-binding protein [Marinilabilia salmonicolor]PRY93831.1 iron complex transport system ATP-binding protein [Marinilabilia salmonicolor]
MVIEVKKVSFGYSTEKVLHDVDCVFEGGGFYAVIGPNGSGKSTMIRLLNRLLIPDTGTVQVNGRSVQDYPRRFLAQHIGYVPQSGGSSANATVFDTILLGRKPHIKWAPGKSDFKKTVNIIRDFSLEHLTLRLTGELSGGELQRVHIARALVQEPDVLILDEPTSSLDLSHQIEVMKMLKEVSTKGITVIVAIHDLNLALRYANQFLLLRDGSIIAMGDERVISEQNLRALYDVEVQKVDVDGQSYILPLLR